MVYELLTGSHPFSTADARSVLPFTEPVDVEAFAPAVRNLLRVALSYDQRLRPSSAADLYARLETALAR